MHLLPPEGQVIHLDDYRKRDNVVALDPRRFDVAQIRREWDRVAEAAGHGDLDSAA